MLFGLRKDHLAGALIAGIGAFAVLASQSYGTRMSEVGPGDGVNGAPGKRPLEVPRR